MKHYLLALPLFLVAISGCNATDISTDTAKKSKEKQMIHAIKYNKNKLSIEIISTGCTSAQSFEQLWQEHKLTLKRIKADNCRRLPHKKWLTFNLSRPFSELSLINKLAP